MASLKDPTVVFCINLLLVIIAIASITWIIHKANVLIAKYTNLTPLLSLSILGAICILFSGDLTQLVNSIYDFVTFPLLAPKSSNILLDAVKAVNKGEYSFELGDVILFCLVSIGAWMLACWLLSITKNYISLQINLNPQIDLFDLYMTKAFLVTLFFVIALFLVIASIVAVPEFQSIQTNTTFDKLEQEFNVDLAQRLDSLSVPDLKFDIDESHKKLDSTLKVTNRILSDRGNKYRWSVDSLAVEYATLVERFMLFRENQRPTLVYAYTREMLSGLSERNRNAYRSQLITGSINQTYSIAQRMKAIRSRFVMWYRSAAANHFYPINIKNTNLEIQGVKKILSIQPEPAPDPSTGLGVFGFMSRWLLKTRSISLALIVGMFGFGLLGAIASSFVRERIDEPDPSKKTTKQIVANLDLRTILITGVTAAVVIFLSVKGALIVFTSPDNGGSINPYILFFICFAAALYNEVVWKWVVDRFTAYLNGSPGKDNPEAQLHLQAIPDQIAQVNQPYTFTIPTDTITSSSKEPVRIEIGKELPAGLKATNNTIAGTPTQSGTYDIIVSGSITTTVKATVKFKLTVTDKVTKATSNDLHQSPTHLETVQ